MATMICLFDEYNFRSYLNNPLRALILGKCLKVHTNNSAFLYELCVIQEITATKYAKLTKMDSYENQQYELATS